MKQLFFIAVLLSAVLIISCNKSFKSDESNLAPKGFAEVDSNRAKLMITHFYESSLINILHGLDTPIMRINLIRDDIRWQILDSKTKDITFFSAAYLATDPDMANRNKLTILIQLKKPGAGTVYNYYDINKPENTTRLLKTICPPPPCRTIY